MWSWLFAGTDFTVEAAETIPRRPGSANLPDAFFTAAKLKWFASV